MLNTYQFVFGLIIQTDNIFSARSFEPEQRTPEKIKMYSLCTIRYL